MFRKQTLDDVGAIETVDAVGAKDARLCLHHCPVIQHHEVPTTAVSFITSSKERNQLERNTISAATRILVSHITQSSERNKLIPAQGDMISHRSFKIATNSCTMRILDSHETQSQDELSHFTELITGLVRKHTTNSCITLSQTIASISAKLNYRSSDMRRVLPELFTVFCQPVCEERQSVPAHVTTLAVKVKRLVSENRNNVQRSADSRRTEPDDARNIIFNIYEQSVSL